MATDLKNTAARVPAVVASDTRFGASADRWISAAEVCERLNISTMSLWRWLQNDDLGFPRPVKIRNRRYFSERLVAEWQADAVTRAQLSPEG
jgi:predicted DNA-binding transcriptional regulator AlpA